MKKILLQFALCLVVFGSCLYLYLDTQNELTHLKIRLPEIEKEIKLAREENRRLAYEIDQFENPTRLIEFAHNPEFAHLKHPMLKEIMTVSEMIACKN